MPLKNLGWFQNFGKNTNVKRVSFVGWWLVVGWIGFFFAHFDFRVDRRPELRED